jgi:hypothetical protein
MRKKKLEQQRDSYEASLYSVEIREERRTRLRDEQ